MTSTGDQYELCMRAENVYLPSQGYFGVTAATGGLAGMRSIVFVPLILFRRTKSIN